MEVQQRMADLAYRNDMAVTTGNPRWGAIWAGVFAFVAIWSVFGSLGAAIFASAANPNAAAPVSGMGWGIGIWSIVLTAIAMFVAGRVTAHLAGVEDRGTAMLQGLTMFGLSVVSAVVIIVLGGAAMSGGTGVNGTVHSASLLDTFAGLGWAGFLSLFFGWLTAMWGASTGVKTTAAVNTADTRNVRSFRPAA